MAADETIAAGSAANPASPATTLTHRFLAGRYDVLEPLGEGVLIASYRARDRSLNRIVTLKTPLTPFSDREDVRARLRDGLGRVLSLAQNGIVRTYDVGEDAAEGGLFYIVEEYIRGIDLKERIRRAAPFQLAAANDVAIAIAEALEYAQTRGVAHGDVRPQNVLVGAATPGVDGGGIKLTGFGLASAQSLAIGDDPAALRRIVPYRAPEVGRDTPPMAGADVYALGVVLYELLTGELPYSGDTAFEIAVRHADGAIPSASAVNGSVPPALDGILRVALSKSPEARYASATEMLKDLRTVRDNLRYGKPLTWAPEPRALPAPVVIPPLTLTDTLATLPTREAQPIPPVAPLVRAAVVPEPEPEPEPYDPYSNSATGTVSRRAVAAPTQSAPVEVPRERQVAPVYASAAAASPTAPAAAVVPLTGTAVAEATSGRAENRRAAAAAPRPEEEEAPVNRGNRERNDDGGGGNRYLTSINLALSLLVVLAIGFLIWQASNFFKPADDVVVPNLVGKSTTDARAMANEQKFELAVVDSQYRDNDPVDVIYQMEPAAGRHIREGKQVEIWVSKGPHMVPVPDVTSKTLEEATQALVSANLRVGDKTPKFDPFVPRGSVIQQTPDSTGQAPRGGKVDLVVSKGEEPTPDPNAPATSEPAATDTPTAAATSPSNSSTPGAATPAPNPTPDTTDNSEGATRVRTFDVKYPVPKDNLSHHIRIDVTDRDGTKTVFDETHKAGDAVHQRIQAVGHQIHIRLFDNDVLASELTKK